MLTQILTINADGTGALVIRAEPVALGELVGLEAELNLRSTITTEARMNVLPDEGPQTEE
jgi:hypothetical protein